MKPIPAAFLLLFAISALTIPGCADRGTAANNTNATVPPVNITNQTNGTVAPSGNTTQNLSGWPRYDASRFSFFYLPGLEMSEVKDGPNGIISGEHKLPSRTAEIFAVRYVDTIAAYGKNRDLEFKTDPTTAASDFLAADKENDTMGFFMKASMIGNISTSTLGREAYVAELPFRVVMNSGTVYTGYALSIYVPERSMHVDVRIIALDPDIAKEMESQFLLGFRLI